MKMSNGVTDLEQIHELEHQAVEHLNSGPSRFSMVEVEWICDGSMLG